MSGFFGRFRNKHLVVQNLAQKEQQLYDITIKLKRLEVKAEKDLDDSQSHVAEYANRNNELSIKVRVSRFWRKITVANFTLRY